MRRIARRTGCVQFWKIARPLHSVAMPRWVPITAGSEARKLANSHTDMHAQWSVPTAVTEPTCELPCRQRSGERAPSCCVCSSESRASCTCEPAATIAPTPSVSSAGAPPPPLPPIRGTYFAAPFVITISEFAVSPLRNATWPSSYTTGCIDSAICSSFAPGTCAPSQSTFDARNSATRPCIEGGGAG